MQSCHLSIKKKGQKSGQKELGKGLPTWFWWLLYMVELFKMPFNLTRQEKILIVLVWLSQNWRCTHGFLLQHPEIPQCWEKLDVVRWKNKEREKIRWRGKIKRVLQTLLSLREPPGEMFLSKGEFCPLIPLKPGFDLKERCCLPGCSKLQ